MTISEFNNKYKDYLEDGHYGLDISYEPLITYLDRQFTDLIKIPGFKYMQIKEKFGCCRFYNNLRQLLPVIGDSINNKIESCVDVFLQIQNELK